MSPATLFPLQRSAGDDLGDCKQVLQVQRGVPPRIVLAVPGYGYLTRSVPQNLERVECATNLGLSSNYPDQILHHCLQIVFDLVGVFSHRAALEGLEGG